MDASRGTLTTILVLITALSSCCHQCDLSEKVRVARSTSTKPQIVERPKRQIVHVNQTAKFVCRVKSDSPVTITWVKSQQELRNRPGSILLTDSSLIFLHVQKSDEGIYKCVARNRAGTSSSEAKLTVLDPLIAPVIIQVTGNLTVLEGQRVTLSCKATGNPLPHISWRISLDRNSADRQPERPSPGSIRILSASPRDSGTYSCIASNKRGNDTRVVYLKVLGYPEFVESPPSNTTAGENTTISLNCKVMGSPTPEVRWYYRNKQVGRDEKTVVLSNKTLVISHVKFEDSGTYTCVANNSAGLRRSRTTLLRVLSRPRLSCCSDYHIISRNETAIDGKSTSLNCSAVGYPEPKYDWRLSNVTVSLSPVFTIPNVSRNNEGVYSCQAYNHLGSFLLKIFLSVLVPPKVVVTPEKKVVLPGDRVQFVCTATGYPTPTVRWYSSKAQQLRYSSLVIANVTQSDQGEYFCEGKSKAGREIATGTLAVAVRPTFAVLSLRNITANETSSVRVQCSAKGPDLPVIKWYRMTVDGKKTNISAGGKISLSHSALEISHLVRDDGGLYVCEAKNYAGMIDTTFFINVQYRPNLNVSAQHVNIVAGKAASLRCPIEANPAAQIHWIHPVHFHGSLLSIERVDASKEGQYICTGVNLLGSLQATIEVKVLTPPLIVGLKMVEKLNNWISLTCNTKGTPEPTIHWLDQAPLPAGSFTVQLGNLQMDKRYLYKSKFVCNASNAYGWTSKYVRTPSSPYKLHIIHITSSSVTLTWMTNGTEIISHFVMERLSKANSEWTMVNSSVPFSMFSDHDLQPFTWFSFRVSAKNVLGTSDPSEPINVTTREGVPSRPTSVAAVSRELTTITLDWKPPSEPRGLLTNILYEVYYVERGAPPDNEMKLIVNNSVEYELKISSLKSDTMYMIKVRAGRKAIDGDVYWSGYTVIWVKTLQEAPVISPEIIKVSSNGPRRIFVSWKRPAEYVEGYELQYNEYESNNNTTSVVIRSWNTTSYMITGLIGSTYYELQLRLFTSGGKGPWSVPVVILTDQDRLALSGSLSSSSDDLAWKIALGGALLALILLCLLLVFVHLRRKSKRNGGSENKRRKEFRKKDRYDFDQASHTSNESGSSIEGIYNVTMEDGIDLSMFDNSHHTSPGGTASTMYVENPILPLDQLENDDDYQPVRLATFTTRPSPLPTPGTSPKLKPNQLPSSQINYDADSQEPPVYAKVDFAAKARSRNKSASASLEPDNEHITDDILI